MGFQGSLDTVGLADIFQLFGFGRKSGALHLRRNGEHGVIHFAEGDVFYATMSPGDVIGNLLVRADLVTPDQWKAIVADAGDDRLQGEVLGTIEGIDTVAVEVFLRERVEDTVFRIAQWEGGEFELEEDAHPFGPAFRFPAEPLLATAERRMEEWRRICEVVPSTAMGVAVVRDLPPELPEVTLGREQWRLLATITPGCDVSEVAASLGETEFRACRTLAEMLERGVVELIAEEKLAALRALLASDTAAPAPAPEAVSPSEGDDVPVPHEQAPPAATAGGEAWGEPGGTEVPIVTGLEPGHSDEGGASKLSLAELAAAAEAGPPQAEVSTASTPDPEIDTGFAVGDLMAEYVPSEAAPEPEALPHAYLDAVTPPPAVYSSFEQPATPTQPAFPDTLVGPAGHEPPAVSTGEVPAQGAAPQAPAPSPPPLQPPHLEYPTEYPGDTPLSAPPGVDANGATEAAGGDSELDKSLILRLIAGVKSL